jgi:nicotinamidase-related amidase
LLAALQEALPAVKPIERRSMNVWEDDTARNAVVATNRRRLIIARFLTEACVSFPTLSALKDGFEVFVVGDACGGLAPKSHEVALRRLEQEVFA